MTDSGAAPVLEEPARRVGGGPQPYDFRRPNRFSRENVRALQIVNETFARQLATVLSTTLRVVSLCPAVTVAQVTYDEYVREVPTPSLLAVLSLDPLPGSGVFQMPMGIAMSVVDRLLGGHGGGDQPNRVLSDIETGLLRQLLQRIVHELTYSFETLAPLKAQVVDLESDAQFMQLAPASEPVIVSSYAVVIGDQQATATLCLPFPSLQPVLDASSGRSATRTPGAGHGGVFGSALQERLQDVPVEVTVTFRPIRVTSTDLLHLAPGDLVPLRHSVSSPLAVVADGVRVAAAVPGSSGARLAVQVVSG